MVKLALKLVDRICRLSMQLLAVAVTCTLKMLFMKYETNPNINRLRQVFKKILLSLFIGFIGSCTTIKFTNQQPNQPKKGYYSFNKEKSSEVGIIDTIGVYINEQN